MGITINPLRQIFEDNDTGISTPPRTSTQGGAAAQTAAFESEATLPNDTFVSPPRPAWATNSAYLTGGTAGEPPPASDQGIVGLSTTSTDDPYLPADAADPNPIERLQRLLIARGVLTEGQASTGWGCFGPATETAVEDFQRAYGLPVTGVVDERTAAYLENPPPMTVLAGNRDVQMRETVRQDAMTQFRAANPGATEAQVIAAGDQAAQRYDAQIRQLANDEISQYLAANPDVNLANMSAGERADLEARALNAAITRFELSHNALNNSYGEMTNTEAMDNLNTATTDSSEWNDWCQAFVSTAYDFQIPEMRTGSANSAIEAFRQSGQLVEPSTTLAAGGYPDFSNVPAGAAVYFGREPHGHVGIFTGEFTAEGEPIIRTTGYNSATGGRNGITDMPFSELMSEFDLTYVGYVSYPDPNPNGF